MDGKHDEAAEATPSICMSYEAPDFACWFTDEVAQRQDIIILSNNKRLIVICGCMIKQPGVPGYVSARVRKPWFSAERVGRHCSPSLLVAQADGPFAEKSQANTRDRDEPGILSCSQASHPFSTQNEALLSTSLSHTVTPSSLRPIEPRNEPKAEVKPACRQNGEAHGGPDPKLPLVPQPTQREGA